MTIKKSVLLLFLVFISAQSQNSLEYFIKTAEKNNPLLKEYSNQISISSLQLELIHSQSDLPNIYLSAGYLFAPYFNNNGKFISANPDSKAIGYDIGLSNGGLYSAQINLEKNIFNGFSTSGLKDQQSIQEQSIQNNIRTTEREITKQVTDQYILTYQSLKNYGLSKETMFNLKDQLTIIKKLVENGAVKQSLYLLLSIEYENQNMVANDYYLQYKTNLNQLITLCGISDTNVVMIDSVSLTLNNNVLRSDFFKKFELDSLALNNQQQLYESKYQPQVSLFMNTGVNAVEINNIQRKFGMSAGINFSFPLYDGDQRSITEQQHQLTLDNVHNYKESFGIQLSNQKKNSLARLENLRKNSDNYSKQLISYEQIIKITESELQRGQISMVEYLTILKNYIELRKNKISVETDIQREINNYNYWNQ